MADPFDDVSDAIFPGGETDRLRVLVAEYRGKVVELEAENGRLRSRVTELQTEMTRMVELRRARDINQQVREFFVIAEQKLGERPHVPDAPTVRFRLRLVAEEFFELFGAVDGSPTGSWYLKEAADIVSHHIDWAPLLAVDLPELADACADLDYVVAGLRAAFGIDGGPIAELVHKANMAKAGGPKRESDGKRLKPPGWTPPDVAGELRRQGWDGK